jgi:hypothetical protein
MQRLAALPAQAIPGNERASHGAAMTRSRHLEDIMGLTNRERPTASAAEQEAQMNGSAAHEPELELSDDDLDHVVGGLDRPYIFTADGPRLYAAD